MQSFVVQIRKKTGAGDAFAAGFLMSRLLVGLTDADGVELGSRLARHCMGSIGAVSVDGFEQVFQAFMGR